MGFRPIFMTIYSITALFSNQKIKSHVQAMSTSESTDLIQRNPSHAWQRHSQNAAEIFFFLSFKYTISKIEQEAHTNLKRSNKYSMKIEQDCKSCG